MIPGDAEADVDEAAVEEMTRQPERDEALIYLPHLPLPVEPTKA